MSRQAGRHASPTADVRGIGWRALLLHAWSGSRGGDAVVTAFVLAASRPSVSAPSDDRTDPSPMRIVRACGDERVSCLRGRDTCFGSGRVTSAPAPSGPPGSSVAAQCRASCAVARLSGTLPVARCAQVGSITSRAAARHAGAWPWRGSIGSPRRTSRSGSHPGCPTTQGRSTQIRHGVTPPLEHVPSDEARSRELTAGCNRSAVRGR
jgi:hypothetical protein